MLTADREYTTMDKSSWDRGAWDDEPDKIQWVDAETGYDCLIVRNSLGALCGYVGLPPWAQSKPSHHTLSGRPSSGTWQMPSASGAFSWQRPS